MTQRHFQYQVRWILKHFRAGRKWSITKVTTQMADSNYSWPFADNTRGNRSNSVLGVFHPNLRQSWSDNQITIHSICFSNELSYVCYFRIHRVACVSSIGIQISRIRNQLWIPNAKVMLSIRPLWENCNCRTENQNRQLTCCSLTINHVCLSHPLRIVFLP